MTNVIRWVRAHAVPAGVLVAVVVAVAVCLPTLLTVGQFAVPHRYDNPEDHQPQVKPATTTVSAGQDCGSFPEVPYRAALGGQTTDDAKVVVLQGSTTCGLATKVIADGYTQAQVAGREFATSDHWSCTVLDSRAVANGFPNLVRREVCHSARVELLLTDIAEPNPK